MEKKKREEKLNMHISHILFKYKLLIQSIVTYKQISVNNIQLVRVTSGKKKKELSCLLQGKVRKKKYPNSSKPLKLFLYEIH